MSMYVRTYVCMYGWMERNGTERNGMEWNGMDHACMTNPGEPMFSTRDHKQNSGMWLGAFLKTSKRPAWMVDLSPRSAPPPVDVTQSPTCASSEPSRSGCAPPGPRNHGAGPAWCGLGELRVPIFLGENHRKNHRHPFKVDGCWFSLIMFNRFFLLKMHILKEYPHFWINWNVVIPQLELYLTLLYPVLMIGMAMNHLEKGRYPLFKGTSSFSGLT